MHLRLPPLFRVDLREEGNSVRQALIPPWTGESDVQPISEGRARGFQLLRTNLPPIVLLTASSKPHPAWTHVLRLRDANPVGDTMDLSKAIWVRHPDHEADMMQLADYEQNVEATVASWSDGISYRREDPKQNINGLRPPQLGALWAIQSHWTAERTPGTVVIPTGVGKTETMLATLIAERCPRLLIVVPTDALRTQIREKVLYLGLLRSFGVVAPTARYPVVGTLSRRPTTIEEVESFFRKCNVVVTTMPLAAQCGKDVIARMAALCPYLFIDEAHHVAAPKWREFCDVFSSSRIIQFTATPYRNDDKPIGGKRVYTFTLRHAQEQGYFKRIQFKHVVEFDPARKDKAIAESAVEQLRAESHLGHIVMARVDSVARAAEVFECYREYTEFNPVQIHTGITSKTARDEARRQLLAGESRIVVCVDMLGEGFDLPELKIAAFHDIRKSLSVTLQLAGRFTRVKPNLGNATFIANIADLEVKHELRKLYQHDSDWNVLLPQLSEEASDGEFSLAEFLGGFQELPDDITLRNVRPAMSTVVYRTSCEQWTPENFRNGIPGVANLDKVYDTYNPHENTLVIVTTRRVPVDWAQIDEIHNWDWQLYVLHWDKDRGLLFIHNSSNAGFFKKLAEAVAGKVEQLRGPLIFRSLAGINRLKLQNVGLLEQLGRLIRYTMRAGSDVEAQMSQAQKEKAIRANLFGQGYEGGHRMTIGCSYRGRIWSYRTANLLTLTQWCRHIGGKLLDEHLDPEEVLRGTLVPKPISVRPNKVPIAVDWPELFYKEPEQAFSFEIAGQTIYRCDAELAVVAATAEGDLDFQLTSQVARASFRLRLHGGPDAPDFAIDSIDCAQCTIKHRGRQVSLQEFFSEEPPTFWFADGSSLTGIEYVELRQQPEPFARDRIEAWDWTNVNIRLESQGIDRDNAAIQFRVIEEMKRREFTVVFDDDDQGESADVVGIRETPDSIEIEFWHCKYSQGDAPGHRIKDMYELCGQAQKSVRWMEKPRDLFTHLLRREPRRYQGQSGTRYEHGSEADLLRIREKSEVQRVQLRIYIVQPGLSKQAASREQLELLSVTENYLMETFAVPFSVVSSA